MTDLPTAIRRLRAFRDSRAERDQIDSKSGLTVADLDEVLVDLEGRYAREPDDGDEAAEGMVLEFAPSSSPPPAAA